MSLLGSTSKSGGSQPDLSKSSEGSKTTDKPQITFRKRKEPESDLKMKEEFESLKNEMRSFLTKFSTIQNEGMASIRQDMNEIKEQLAGIKICTDKIIEDQEIMKKDIDNLKFLSKKNELKIKSLQSTLSPSHSNISTNSYDEIIYECQERITKQKNIIIFNLPESSSKSSSDRLEYDKNEVSKIINKIVDNCCQPIKIFRIGKYNPQKPRPLKVCFENADIALQILRNKNNQSEFKIYSDQTYKQRKHLSQLKEELLTRQEEGEQNLVIKYVKGTPKIITQQSKN